MVFISLSIHTNLEHEEHTKKKKKNQPTQGLQTAEIALISLKLGNRSTISQIISAGRLDQFGGWCWLDCNKLFEVTRVDWSSRKILSIRSWIIKVSDQSATIPNKIEWNSLTAKHEMVVTTFRVKSNEDTSFLA